MWPSQPGNLLGGPGDTMTDKGPLQSWVVSIARYRAIDRFNQKLDDVQKQKTYKIHASAAERSAPMFAVQAADHADEVVDALDASHEVTAILRVVEDVIQSRESTARGSSLILILQRRRRCCRQIAGDFTRCLT